MNTIAQSTTPVRTWHHLDASGKVVGRLATEIAVLLRGKHKTVFRRYNDVGDIVVVTNAAKVVLTGQKESHKTYRHHSGYPGGLKEIRARHLREQHPVRIIENAVIGMLPKTKQRDVWMKRLKVYVSDEHPHQANIHLTTQANVTTKDET